MKADDAVVSCDVARDDASILIVTESGYGKRTQLDKFNRQTRGGQGVRGIKLTAKKGYVERDQHWHNPFKGFTKGNETGKSKQQNSMPTDSPH